MSSLDYFFVFRVPAGKILYSYTYPRVKFHTHTLTRRVGYPQVPAPAGKIAIPTGMYLHVPSIFLITVYKANRLVSHKMTYTNFLVPNSKGSLSHSSYTAHIKRLLLKAIIPLCHNHKGWKLSLSLIRPLVQKFII